MKTLTRRDAAEALAKLRGFIGHGQLAAIGEACYGGERQFFYGKLAELAALVESMPKTNEQDGKGDAATVALHYFIGSSDWYIIEKDIEDGASQAFGFACLNGDWEMAEFGYISITELVQHGVELDLYWTPKTLAEVKAERRTA